MATYRTPNYKRVWSNGWQGGIIPESQNSKHETNTKKRKLWTDKKLETYKPTKQYIYKVYSKAFANRLKGTID